MYLAVFGLQNAIDGGALRRVEVLLLEGLRV